MYKHRNTISKKLFYSKFFFYYSLCFPSHSLQYILETRASGVYLIDHSACWHFYGGKHIATVWRAIWLYQLLYTRFINIHKTIALDDMSKDSHSFLINKDNDKSEILYENTIKCIIRQNKQLMTWQQNHTLY